MRSFQCIQKYNLTRNFSINKPENPKHDKIYAIQKHRSTDLKLSSKILNYLVGKCPRGLSSLGMGKKSWHVRLTSNIFYDELQTNSVFFLNKANHAFIYFLLIYCSLNVAKSSSGVPKSVSKTQ